MINKIMLQIIAISFCLCSYSWAVSWTGTNWDADELPQDFLSGTVFSTVGSGSEIIFAEDDPSHPWGGGFSVYRHIAVTGDYGFKKWTKPGIWDVGLNSTVEFRLKIDSFFDNKDTVFDLTVRNDDLAFVVGFKFGRSTTGTIRIWAYEASSNYIDFDHTADFITYRFLIDNTQKLGRLYYWDEVTDQWIHLITSQWLISHTVDSGLHWGDPSNDYAGRFGIDYIYWTQDGLILDEPLFCGSPGTQYNEYDFNADCYVDIQDFAFIAEDWLHCTDPEDSGCDVFWTSLDL